MNTNTAQGEKQKPGKGRGRRRGEEKGGGKDCNFQFIPSIRLSLTKGCLHI